MASHKQRVMALRALVSGSVLAGTPVQIAVDAELEQVFRAGRVKIAARRMLLQVLHSTRALDSTLKELLDYYGVLGGAVSLGQYLYRFRDHLVGIGPASITEAQRSRYQANIVDPRNTFMHEAGAAPLNDTEVATLLAEMDACLSDVFSL